MRLPNAMKSMSCFGLSFQIVFASREGMEILSWCIVFSCITASPGFKSKLFLDQILDIPKTNRRKIAGRLFELKILEEQGIDVIEHHGRARF